MRIWTDAVQVSNQIERGLLGMGAAEAGSPAEEHLRAIHTVGTQVCTYQHKSGCRCCAFAFSYYQLRASVPQSTVEILCLAHCDLR